MLGYPVSPFSVKRRMLSTLVLKEIHMKKSLMFLAGATLAAALVTGCFAPVTPEAGGGGAPEYVAQGRQLVTVSIDLPGEGPAASISRAINTDVINTYANFWEVVFVNGTESYSATMKKGAGNTLTIKLPKADGYTAYLAAGHLLSNNNAVLLSQNGSTYNGSAGKTVDLVTSPTTPVSFNLVPLALSIGTVTGLTNIVPTWLPDIAVYPNDGSTLGSPVIPEAASGLPYFPIIGGSNYTVAVNTGVTAFVTTNPVVDVVPLINGKDHPPVVLGIVKGDSTFADPAIDTYGNVTFTIAGPAWTDVGVSNVGFDVAGKALTATRTAGTPVTWHIRNGLDVATPDNGKNDVTNIGAGILFGVNGGRPSSADSWVEVPIGVN
jgi:hypothetical protein